MTLTVWKKKKLKVNWKPYLPQASSNIFVAQYIWKLNTSWQGIGKILFSNLHILVVLLFFWSPAAS